MDSDHPKHPRERQGGSGDLAHDEPPEHADEPPEHAARAKAGDELLGRTLALVRHLRTHCSWDARQTPGSLRPYLLEEAHETADAVLAGDDGELVGELGDLLLNVAFQVVLAEEREAFGAPEVVGRLEAKMRDRHPHVYGDAEEPPDWEEMKARERAAREEEEDADVPTGLQPLDRSLRVQQRAAAVGFDWAEPEGALAKLAEEIDELRGVLSGRGGGGTDADSRHPGGTVPDAAVEEEVGDLLFAAVNAARLAGVHPTDALAGATRKFETRFREVARRARERSLDLRSASLEEMEAIWREVKADEDGEP